MIVSLSTELARSCLPVSLRHRETQYPNFIIPFITENGRPQRFPIVFYIKAHRYDAIKYACKITFSKISFDLDTFLIDFLVISLFHSLFLYNIIVASISLRRVYRGNRVLNLSRMTKWCHYGISNSDEWNLCKNKRHTNVIDCSWYNYIN